MGKFWEVCDFVVYVSTSVSIGCICAMVVVTPVREICRWIFPELRDLRVGIVLGSMLVAFIAGVIAHWLLQRR